MFSILSHHVILQRGKGPCQYSFEILYPLNKVGHHWHVSQMAFLRRGDDGPKLNAGLIYSFAIFQGWGESKPVFLRKPTVLRCSIRPPPVVVLE